MADGFMVLQWLLLKRGKSIGHLTARQGKQSLITPAVVFMLPLCFSPSSSFSLLHWLTAFPLLLLLHFHSQSPYCCQPTPHIFSLLLTPFFPTKWDGPFCCRCISTISHAGTLLSRCCLAVSVWVFQRVHLSILGSLVCYLVLQICCQWDSIEHSPKNCNTSHDRLKRTKAIW